MAMSVRVVAYTAVDMAALAETGYIPHDSVDHPDEPVMFLERGPNEWQVNPAWREWQRNTIPTDIDELHECAGRRCYNSWHRPNPKTATNKGYLDNILTTEHFSVVAHGHVTYAVEGVSRALLLELERHQKKSHLNFSVVSQRYVDHSQAEMVIPPLLAPHLDEQLHEPPADGGPDPYEYGWTVRDELEAITENAQDAYRWLEKFMERKGYGRKQIRGAVRAVLPENTETKFLVTASVRGWRDVLEQRLPFSADEEIRLFAVEILRGLIRVAPNSVQDYAEAYEEVLNK